MTTYIDAKWHIVHMDNNDIITESAGVGDPFQEGTHPGEAPVRRRSIWN